jgi:hypothetical protein
VSLRSITGLCLGILLLASAGCATPLFSVAPMPASMPPDRAATKTRNGFAVEASFVSELQSQDQFDANLPLAGIIAIEARFINQTDQPIAPGKLGLELTSSSGTRYKGITPSAALKRLMKFYGETYYFQESYRRTRDSFDTVGLPLDRAIVPGADAHGFLFFKAPSRSRDLTGLVLTMKHGGTPVAVKLN